MRAIRRISPPLLVFLLLSLARVSAAAPMGSISIRMTYEHQPIPGGSVTLYQAARLADGRYVPAPEFAEHTGNLEGALSPEDAQILAEHAAENRLPGQTQKLDDDGFARFSPLEPGLYLLVQAEAATGFLPVISMRRTPIFIASRWMSERSPTMIASFSGFSCGICCLKLSTFIAAT